MHTHIITKILYTSLEDIHDTVHEQIYYSDHLYGEEEAASLKRFKTFYFTIAIFLFLYGYKVLHSD